LTGGDGTFSPVSEENIYTGRIVSLGVGTFRAPDGSTFNRDIVHHPGAVAVVPLLDDGRVVFVRQYRAPLDADVLEIPAGIRDVDGEPPDGTARRELVEEVGLDAEHVELLCHFHNSPGCSDEEVFVFLGTGLTDVGNDLQGVEEQHMTVERIPLDDAITMIAKGEITDAKTIIGLTLARAR
jgi:ADP-ribose pyrophosphatase